MCLEITDFRTSSEIPFLKILLEANMVDGIATARNKVNDINMVTSSVILAVVVSDSYS